MVLRVILDSSFLIDAPRFHIDITKELIRCLATGAEPVILSPILDELNSIVQTRGINEAKAALLALKVAESFPVENVERRLGESADDMILRVAQGRGWVVATNDRLLRRRLRDSSVPTVYLRQKSHIEVQGVG